MFLLYLSTELLHSIFTTTGVLQKSDFYNIFLTCKRFNLIARPLLYQEVQVQTPIARETDSRQLDLIIQHFGRYQERLSWVRVIRASWDRRKCTETARMFDLLSLFANVHTLILSACGGWDEDGPFLRFAAWCKHFQLLQNMEVSNSLMTIHDILDFCAAPKLDSLILWNFKISEELSFTPHQLVPPTNLRKLEILRTKAFPMGPCVEVLFRGMVLLESLVWTLETQYYTIRFNPREVSRVLSPLKATLQNLHLSLVDSWGFRNDAQLDFSDFTALKRLKIHERLMLANSTPPTRSNIRREDLQNRLPSSLQDLTIIFDVGAHILRTEPSEEVNHGWILSLAEKKLRSSTCLEKVTLTERCFWPMMNRGKTEADFAPSIKWDHPDQVKIAFKDAAIELLVMLRASENWSTTGH